MTIVFVDYVVEPSNPGRSGLSDIVWSMASELVHLGHDVHVVASYSTEDLPDSNVVYHHIPLPPMGYRNVVGNAWLIWRASRIVSMINPDVVHAPEYLSTALMAIYGMKAPLILTVPGNIFQRLSTPNGSGYEWYFAQILKWAARLSARRCDSIIAISSDMKRWWEWTGASPDKTPVIPLGGDSDRFHYVEGAKTQLGLPSCHMALYVGRFSREKGLFDLIEAVSLLPDDARHDLRVVMIGRGVLGEELANEIGKRSLSAVVSIIPWVDQNDLALWYSAADTLVLPSYTEGFSRTIVESMMCGTPVIGSRISGTEDHVHDGRTGYLFEAGDSEKLSSLLGTLVNESQLFLEMREHTKRYAADHFLWSRIAQQVVDQAYKPAVLGS